MVRVPNTCFLRVNINSGREISSIVNRNLDEISLLVNINLGREISSTVPVNRKQESTLYIKMVLTVNRKLGDFNDSKSKTGSRDFNETRGLIDSTYNWDTRFHPQ